MTEKFRRRGTVKCTAWLFSLILIGSAFFSANVPAYGETGSAGGPRDIMLSVTSDVCTSQTVTWHDDGDTDAGYVIYAAEEQSVIRARESGDDSGVLSAAGRHVSVESGADVEDSIFSALLENLQPETTYYYFIRSDSGVSEISGFTTAAEDQQSLSFLYMGDIQFEEDMEQAYEDWAQLVSSVYRRNPDLAFGLMGGDIVQNGIRTAEWDAFLKNASGIFSSLPFMPVNGNHESNIPGGKPELYMDMFTLPENGPEGFEEEFYSFDYGTCHVTALNSWVFSGEQALTEEDYENIAEWIRSDLENSGAVWNIVVMHHPVYSLASDNVSAQVRENWAPIFEECGVDLVFCGHQHVYSRSYPMKDGAVDYEDGITYIMGNSGQKFYTSADETYQARTIYSTSTCQVVRIDGETLEVMTYDRDGNELDYCSLRPREKNSSAEEPGGESPGTGDPGSGEENGVFLDVADSAWYADAVDYVSSRGLMSGTGGGLFSPDGSMTRGMFVTVLYRMDGSGAGDENAAGSRTSAVFEDVAADAYYADACAWAAENGIVTGTDETHFSPSEPITRQQMAAVLYRYNRYAGETDGGTSGTGTDTDAQTVLSGFADAERISSYAREPLAWAVENGIFSGTQEGGRLLLQPGATATRAQCAAVFMRYGS